MIAWNKGLTKETDERVKKYSESKIGKKYPKMTLKKQQENNPNWKGDKVSYSGVHAWIKSHKIKPNTCEVCKQKRKLELANLSGKYKRDITDYLWLCRSCHSKFHRGTKEWYNWIFKYRRGK